MKTSGNMPPTTASAQGQTCSKEMVELIPALRAFARSLTRDYTDADDLVQETLLRGLANIEKFRPGTALRAWLFTIMRNSYYNEVQKRARETTGELDCISTGLIAEPTQEWTIRGREVLRAIGNLPPNFRETLVLVSMLGESYEAAAGVFGCSIGTVKSRINRARHIVLQSLGESGVHARAGTDGAAPRSHDIPCQKDRQMEKDKGSDGRSRGGQQSGGNFSNDPERATEAGRKGGQESGGNFKNDPERASEAGRKGGEASHNGKR